MALSRHGCSMKHDVDSEVYLHQTALIPTTVHIQPHEVKYSGIKCRSQLRRISKKMNLWLLQDGWRVHLTPARAHAAAAQVGEHLCPRPHEPERSVQLNARCLILVGKVNRKASHKVQELNLSLSARWLPNKYVLVEIWSTHFSTGFLQSSEVYCTP